MRIPCGAGPHHSKPRSNPATPRMLNPRRLARAKFATQRVMLAGRRRAASADQTEGRGPVRRARSMLCGVRYRSADDAIKDTAAANLRAAADGRLPWR